MATWSGHGVDGGGDDDGDGEVVPNVMKSASGSRNNIIHEGICGIVVLEAVMNCLLGARHVDREVLEALRRYA